ncbi:hypothetical protein DDB_G0283941 [Dictyostelium discoideum AX4]|uniref:Transmembrane protein n=1 Tax=Dictyostelium discoideum TaxID=44689 RepID=Q54QC6_DICDI|nr:hypothetical protein DDB_G0283941 [Dictyostelium discoideum AX4]EAL65458.1 hypothetical protein DDB_G0283941 [Dictyostelium discoideum AX4]|eukprot:XP_638818.1 hypothetical protein DDB_G0283941 [Dictyostelium discoideum AX4]
MSNYQLDIQTPLIQESSSKYFYPLQPHTYHEKQQYPNGIKPTTHIQEKYKNDYIYSLTFFILGSPICKVRKIAFISLLLATAYIVIPYIFGLIYVFANLKKL